MVRYASYLLSTDNSFHLFLRCAHPIQIGNIQRFEHTHPVHGMLDLVRRQLNLDADAPFTLLPPASPRSRPRPLYYSTAINLGLHKSRGVPSLLDSMIPPGAPLTARRWLRKLLLLPPTPAVGHAIQAACRSLLENRRPMPAFPAMSPANVVLKIRSQQANDTFFRELYALVRSVGLTCASPFHKEFAGSVLEAVASETGYRYDCAKIAASCDQAMRLIHEVIVNGEDMVENVDSDASSYDVLRNDDSNRKEHGGREDLATVRTQEDRDPLIVPLERMFSSNEDYAGKVLLSRISQIDAAVQQAKAAVRREASTLLSLGIGTLERTQTATGTSRAAAPSLYYDVNNNAVWMKIPRMKLPLAKFPSLEHPRDRNGKLEAGAYSTPALEAAQNEYRRWCSEARDAVRQELKELSARLEHLLTDLASVATFAVIALALDTHTREAVRRGWTLPTLQYDTAGNALPSATTGIGTLCIDEMWPYWLDARPGRGNVVKNSLSLQVRRTCEGCWRGLNGYDRQTVQIIS